VLRSEPGHEAGGATSTDVAEGGAPPATADPAPRAAAPPAPPDPAAAPTEAPAAADLATGAGQAAPRLGYMPGLDGVRALSLLGVMFFHHGFTWATGGFLGVSTFFTLSGFLIALLALGEERRTRHFSLPRFWERRARRLLPAALVAVTVVVLLQRWLVIGSSPRFRGDLLASLFYVANWRFASATETFSFLSPVAHVWSLAIEEQFYLVFPLVFVALTRALGTGRRAGAAFAGLALASFAGGWLLASHGEARLAYYATFSRSGELLAGVVLAYAVATTWGPRGGAPARVRAAAQVGGVVAIGGLAWLWHTTSLDSDRLFHGVTALEAGLSVLLILAAATGGALAWVLALAPLRLLGRISYGAYLLHWPIFLALDSSRTHIDDPTLLFLVRLAATVAAAGASYVLIESPIRFGTPVTRPRLIGGLAVAAALVVGAILLVPVHGGS